MINAETYSKDYERAIQFGREQREKEILDYVKTDEFYARWCEAKGERFGDFLARIIKEDK